MTGIKFSNKANKFISEQKLKFRLKTLNIIKGLTLMDACNLLKPGICIFLKHFIL